MNVLLIGPQGSGKGTQAKLLAEGQQVAHIATGEILRAAITAGTALGKRVEPILDSGGLVPDELMVELIRERLAEPDTLEGFILDGFPRTLAQARALDAVLAQIGRGLTLVLEFQLSDAECERRMLGRAEIEGRSDDTPELIARRLALYHELTEPVVEHYRTQGKLVGIHAERSIEQVFAEVEDALAQAVLRP